MLAVGPRVPVGALAAEASVIRDRVDARAVVQTRQTIGPVAIRLTVRAQLPNALVRLQCQCGTCSAAILCRLMDMQHSGCRTCHELVKELQAKHMTVPMPHLALQLLHEDHATMQSIGQDTTVHGAASVGVPLQIPVQPRHERVRIIAPTPHAAEHALNSVHADQ